MATGFIALIPINATLGFAESLSTMRARHMSMEVRLRPDSNVRLPSEHSLKDAYWVAQFTEANTYNDYATEQGAIGLLKYYAESDRVEGYEPEKCFVSVALKPEIFSMLLSILQNGRLPETIHAEVKGMEQERMERSWRGLLWNVEANDALPIVEIRFDIPLVTELSYPTPINSWDTLPTSDHHPATAHDIKSFEKIVASKLEALKPLWFIALFLLAATLVLIATK